MAEASIIIVFLYLRNSFVLFLIGVCFGGRGPEGRLRAVLFSVGPREDGRSWWRSREELDRRTSCALGTLLGPPVLHRILTTSSGSTVSFYRGEESPRQLMYLLHYLDGEMTVAPPTVCYQASRQLPAPTSFQTTLEIQGTGFRTAGTKCVTHFTTVQLVETSKLKLNGREDVKQTTFRHVNKLTLTEIILKMSLTTGMAGAQMS
ncbi:uncharacterized protein LOC128053181 [Budorcas taxicolor]|uniref:uncharacterized protein LOC128053181 n=1 Tax=Budorcas taxicolor TaxID=37181 RepID=UPI002284DAEA|nr:uncharacterized protein LOC128053181 [Budorcas taxicolor]